MSSFFTWTWNPQYLTQGHTETDVQQTPPQFHPDSNQCVPSSSPRQRSSSHKDPRSLSSKRRGSQGQMRGKEKWEAIPVSLWKGGHASELWHGLPHFSPALPPRPLQSQPGDARASIEKYSCTHKDSHQQRHVPPRSFPGEGWASGIPVLTTPLWTLPSC